MNPVNNMFEDSAYFALHSVDGRRDVKTLKKALDSLPGILSVSVNAQDNTVSVDYNTNDISRETISQHLSELGYLRQFD